MIRLSVILILIILILLIALLPRTKSLIEMTRIKHCFNNNSAKTESFNDMCTIYENGDTDMILQDRLKGLKKYCQKSKHMNCVPPYARPEAGYPVRLNQYPNTKPCLSNFGCLVAGADKNQQSPLQVAGKISLGGGGSILQRDQMTNKDITDQLVNKQIESYTDYSKMSGEDASARLGSEDQTDFGWVGDPLPLTQAWSGEQLHRMYEGDLCRSDQRIAEKMREIGQHAQQAIINRVAFHKKSLAPYVSEELDAAENVDWWTDNQDLDAEMVKDGKKYN